MSIKITTEKKKAFEHIAQSYGVPMAILGAVILGKWIGPP